MKGRKWTEGGVRVRGRGRGVKGRGRGRGRKVGEQESGRSEFKRREGEG